MKPYYLGLSTSGYDPALALVDDQGTVLFAEATERFLQDKRAWGAAPDHLGHLAPVLAAHCGDDARFVVATGWSAPREDGLGMAALMPAAEHAWLRTLHRNVHSHAGAALARHLGLPALPQRRDFDHHLCHAAFACHSAPVDDAVCLVLDGEGQGGTVSLYRFSHGRLTPLWRAAGPGNLGAFYGWLTGACGFDWKAGEEWKVMGLAAFGTRHDKMADAMSRMLVTRNGHPLWAPTLEAAMAEMGPYGRSPRAPLMDAADLAASGQAVYAAWADAILAACRDQGSDNLILTGGCALNSSYNGTILGRHGFGSVHVPCAPGDDGTAVGAALLAWMQDHSAMPLPQAQAGKAGSAFLGSFPDRRLIDAVVRNCGAARITDLGQNGPVHLAEGLARGKIIGIMRGAAEFGPRSLGHRSILADPRPADMKDRLNRQVKGREPYRPFAPMVPAERVHEWFDNAQPSPYMSFTLPWREAKRDAVPAVVHQDGTGRLQTVQADADPWLHAVLSAFEARTGIPVLLNTSFNVMGKPIVHSVQDAMAVLATTNLDGVLLDTVLVEKMAG